MRLNHTITPLVTEIYIYENDVIIRALVTIYNYLYIPTTV